MHHIKVIKDGNVNNVVKEQLVDGVQYVDNEPHEGSFNGITSGAVANIAEQITTAEGNIDSIEKKIPSGASSSNKLVTESGMENALSTIGTGYTPKGNATVATLEALTGQSNGDMYIVTDSGTLNYGALAVSAGNSVAWDSTNEVWYKTNQYATQQEHDTLNTYAQNVAHSIAPEYNGTTGAVAGRLYMHEGTLYLCKEDTSGDWDSSKFEVSPINETFANLKLSPTGIGVSKMSKIPFVGDNGTQGNLDVFDCVVPIPKDERNWWQPNLGKIINAYITNNGVTYTNIARTVVFKMPKDKSFILGQGTYTRLAVLVTEAYPVDGATGQYFSDIEQINGRNYIEFNTHGGEYVSVYFYNSSYDTGVTVDERLALLSCSSAELGFIAYQAPGIFGLVVDTDVFEAGKINDSLDALQFNLSKLLKESCTFEVGSALPVVWQRANTYVGATGTYTTTTQSYTVTRVKAQGSVVLISGRSAGSSNMCLALVYNSYGQIIHVVEENKGQNYNNFVLALPPGAAFIDINYYSTYQGAYIGIPVYQGATHAFVNESISQAVNPLDAAVFNYEVGESITESIIDSNKVLKTDGSLADNSGYDVREFDVEGLEKVFVSGRSPGNANFCLAVAKDSNLNVLATYEVGKGLYYDDFLITLPKNSKTLFVMNEHNHSYGANEADKVKNFYTKAEAQALFGCTSSYWKNKKIWWCGTSIPAGGYPLIVGANLGAEVTNKAVGGSMCRANVRTGDYVGANFNNITSALTMTKAEIEAFITNYATIQPNLTGGAPATLSASDLSRLRAASFEDRLIPYLDGTYDFPDLFVIDHGHNDFKYKLPDNSSDIGLEPTVENITQGVLAEDTYMTANSNEKLESFFGSLDNIKPADKAAFVASLNRNCYKGAVNFIVTLILKYKPTSRIVFISNYENENGDYPSYAPLITAQRDNANSWAFPLCEVFRNLGYSNHIIPGTKNIYSGDYTFNYDIDAFKIYCPDTVHPHSQPDGISNEIYAGVLAEFLKTCR